MLNQVINSMLSKRIWRFRYFGPLRNEYSFAYEIVVEISRPNLYQFVENHYPVQILF